MLFGLVSRLVEFAETEEDEHRGDQREAGDAETVVVRLAQRIDVLCAECSQVGAGMALLGGQFRKLFHPFGSDRSVCQLVRKRGDFGVIGKPVFAEEIIRNAFGRRRGEESADVDAHVEDAEREVALGTVLRIVVEVTHQCLQVAFEAAGTHRDEQQCAEHHHDRPGAGTRGNCQQEVTDEHHDDTQCDGFAVAEYLVGQQAAEQRQEIDGSQEDAEDGTGRIGAEAELSLHEQHENGQHGVVAEAFSHIGQREYEEPLGVSFEHS